MSKHISIAIDGPAGAGKSTMARRVAQELGYVYVDTGAIYRTVGYHMSIFGISPKDVDGIIRLIDDVNIEIQYDQNGKQHMILNGQDVTEELRDQKMSDYASKIAVMKEVRDYLLDLQRKLAKEYDVVMDGRDIGTVVLPKADVKIFLTASPEVRAQRRLTELLEKGNKKETYEKVLEDMKQRDERDMNREIAPLRRAADAIQLDTSVLTIEESVAAMKEIIGKKLAG